MVYPNQDGFVAGALVTQQTAKNPEGFFSSSWFEGLSKPDNSKGGISRPSMFKRTIQKKKEAAHRMKKPTHSANEERRSQ